MDHAGVLLRFEQKVSKGLERARLVLDQERQPSYAAEVHHGYQDKFLLAQSMTNAAVASQLSCLAELGLTPEILRQLCGWAATRAVSLRFRATERWTFDREVSREVEDPTKHVLEVSAFGRSAALTSKVVTTVIDYYWKLSWDWELSAVRGVGESPEDKVRLMAREGVHEVLGGTRESPPHATMPEDFSVNVSWLFRQLNAESGLPAFSIKREEKACRTPSRNPAIEAAQEHFQHFATWAKQVARRAGVPFTRLPPGTLDFGALRPDNVLVPVLPILQDPSGEVHAIAEESQDLLGLGDGGGSGAAAAAAVPEVSSSLVLAPLPDGTPLEAGSLQLTVSELNRLLAEEVRALREKREAIRGLVPGGTSATALDEAILVVILMHAAAVCDQFQTAVQYLEDMLRKQLVAAIGKEVTPADFAEYMRFHNRRLFKEEYLPSPLCFAVRRSAQHSPEGIVSIEGKPRTGGSTSIPEAIVTTCASVAGAQPMRFALNASSHVTFGGERHLHAWMGHSFAQSDLPELTLVSRAHQFSSMIVIVGRIASASVFEPKYAAIVQNKDELTIPLELSTIPTAKEFKDAISSLSPEQQSFAKAFRAMQLQSTLFGVVVLQIKPQLEKVLNLPDDSLTKEIKLTQDLMELFIKYQIPTDLLSFDAQDHAAGMEVVDPTAEEKVNAVKVHVQAIQDMIKAAKEEELREQQEKARLEMLERMKAQAQRNEEIRMANIRERCRESKSEDRMERRSRASYAQDECESAPAPPVAMRRAQLSMPSASGSSVQAAPPPAEVPAAPSAPSSSTPPPASPAFQPPQRRPAGEEALAAQGRDWTKVPTDMDSRFEEFGGDLCLRPAIITPSEHWSRRRQASLLTGFSTSSLSAKEQKSEKDAAFDLLDALTKSGALPVQHAALHVVVAAVHFFDKSVTETLVQDNVNPIEQVERSALIMASTVHQQPAAALIQDAQFARLQNASPALFLADGEVDGSTA